MKIALFSVFALVILSSRPVGGDPNVTILSRLPSLKTFPCSKCHTGYRIGEYQPQGVKQAEFETKHPGMVFRHMEEVRECRTCHHPYRPDSLVGHDGTEIPFDQMQKVCGQCHGKIEYDWNRGLHGKQTGSWQGAKSRWTCAQCHNPHAPKFPLMEAVDSKPVPPAVIRRSH
jgi:hypothetical protein